MKKLLIVLLIGLLVFAAFGCKSREQQMMEQAMQEFEEMTGQEQYADMDDMEDWGDDMEPNDDGFDDDYQNEQAGVDDGDGNGEEMTVDTGDSQVTVNGGEWPSDAPAEVPQLGDGTISATAVTPAGTMVTYTGVAREAADVYAGNLESAGWQKISESIDSDWMQVFFQKDGLYLDIEWDLGDCYITWSDGGI